MCSSLFLPNLLSPWYSDSCSPHIWPPPPTVCVCLCLYVCVVWCRWCLCGHTCAHQCVCMCVYVCTCLCPQLTLLDEKLALLLELFRILWNVQVCVRARREWRIPWNCSSGFCEPSSVDEGNQTQVFWKRSIHFELLNHLLRLNICSGVGGSNKNLQLKCLALRTDRI